MQHSKALILLIVSIEWKSVRRIQKVPCASEAKGVIVSILSGWIFYRQKCGQNRYICSNIMVLVKVQAFRTICSFGRGADSCPTSRRLGFYRPQHAMVVVLCICKVTSYYLNHEINQREMPQLTECFIFIHNIQQAR